MKCNVLFGAAVIVATAGLAFHPIRRGLVMQIMRFPNHQVKAIGKIQSLNSFMKPAAPKMSKVAKKADITVDEDLIPLPRIEIFVRKFSAGLWSPLKQKSIACLISDLDECDDSSYDQTKEQKELFIINEMFKRFNTTSGIEEEDLRNEIDVWIASRLFAEGGLGGERNFIAHVKNLLPQLKKLKPREFEFGYKYVAASVMENRLDTTFMVSPLSSSSNIVYSLTSRERERIAAKSMSSVIEDCQNERDIINPYNHNELDKLFNALFNSATVTPSAFMTLNYLSVSQLDVVNSTQSILDQMFRSPSVYYEVAHFDIYFDGSAHFPSLSSSSNQNTSNSESRSLNTCVKAGAGVFIVSYDSLRQPLSSFQFPVCVHTAAGLVSTPFDAELLAGVVAVTVARNLLEEYSTRESAIPSVTLYTDSKTMCRVFRTMSLNGNNNKTESDVDDTTFSTALLSTRGQPSRQLLGKLLSHHVIYIRDKLKLQKSYKQSTQPVSPSVAVSSPGIIPSTSTADGASPSQPPQLSTKNTDLLRWVAGHPERTKTRREWTRFDTGIWIADEIVKGFIQNDNDIISSINDAISDKAVTDSDTETPSSGVSLYMFAQDFLLYSIISAATSTVNNTIIN